MKFTSSPTKLVRIFNKDTKTYKVVSMNRAQRRRLGIRSK